MDLPEAIRRILQSARGEGICDVCLAFALQMPLATVQAINTDFSVTSVDYVRDVGPCHKCDRVTTRTAFIGVALQAEIEVVADHRRKCVRCSRRVTKEEEHIGNGDLFHRQCWAIVQSQAEIANSRQMVKLSRAVIRRSRERLDDNRSG